MKRMGYGVAGVALLLAGQVLAGPVADVLAVRGEVSVIVAGQRQPLRQGSQLEEGTEVVTGAQGRVRLRFHDGSVIVLSDASQLRIERFTAAGPGQARMADFFMQAGLAAHKVTPAAGGEWKLRTPSTVTAVRGTEFMVEVRDDQTTDVSVQSGQVSVEPARKGRTRALLPPTLLESRNAGTRCSLEGCEQVKEWAPARVQALADRCGGV